MISTVIASFVEKEINPGTRGGGCWMEPLPRVFYMLQYFETICLRGKPFLLKKDEVYFIGGGAAGGL